MPWGGSGENEKQSKLGECREYRGRMQVHRKGTGSSFFCAVRIQGKNLPEATQPRKEHHSVNPALPCPDAPTTSLDSQHQAALPGLAHKSTKYPVKFELQVNSGYIFKYNSIPCNIWARCLLKMICCLLETQV